MDSVDPLAALAATSVTRGYALEPQESGELLLEMSVGEADGRRTTFRLLAVRNGSRLVVHEDPARRLLPVFCPDRHIIDHGYFCMYWEEDRSFDVVDGESAAIWLEVLERFLRLQLRASYLGHWPSREVWAHGFSAARHQMKTEAVAAKLNPEWPSLVLGREMRAVLEPGGCIRVYLGEDQLFSTYRSPNRFSAEKKHRVFAVEGFGKQIRRRVPNRRANLLRELALNLLNWNSSEQSYWDAQKNRDCCGTMDTCELRKRDCGGHKV